MRRRRLGRRFDIRPKIGSGAKSEQHGYKSKYPTKAFRRSLQDRRQLRCLGLIRHSHTLFSSSRSALVVLVAAIADDGQELPRAATPAASFSAMLSPKPGLDRIRLFTSYALRCRW